MSALRTHFLKHLSEAVRMIQNGLKPFAGPEVILPETIAALISLAAFIARNNADLSRDEFMRVASLGADEEWS